LNRLPFFILIVILGVNNVMAFDGITLNNDYIHDIQDGGTDRTFFDKSVRIDSRNFFLTGYLGDFQYGLESGFYIKDLRKSIFNAAVRIRTNNETYQFQAGTEQILGSAFVGRVEFRYIYLGELLPSDSRRNLFVYGLGIDKYYGDYHYFSATFFNDPRETGRFSVVLHNTLATRDSYMRLGIVPRSDGTLGYFGLVKYHWVYAGYAFTREFDFTRLDRHSVSFGLQVPFNLRWSQEE
jgi:hypothetical protein